MAHKYVYLFREGRADMKNLLGGKGANLAEMTALGLPVPQGFTVSTEACTAYYNNNKQIPAEILEQIDAALAQTEEICGKKFGDLQRPLPRVRPLRRARIHARHDGHHPQPGPQRRRRAGPRQPHRTTNALPTTAYRRFIQMFSDVVMEIEKAKFEAIWMPLRKKPARRWIPI